MIAMGWGSVPQPHIPKDWWIFRGPEEVDSRKSGRFLAGLRSDRIKKRISEGMRIRRSQLALFSKSFENKTARKEIQC
jgi:hypothetical protein